MTAAWLRASDASSIPSASSLISEGLNPSPNSRAKRAAAAASFLSTPSSRYARITRSATLVAVVRMARFHASIPFSLKKAAL